MATLTDTQQNTINDASRKAFISTEQLENPTPKLNLPTAPVVPVNSPLSNFLGTTMEQQQRQLDQQAEIDDLEDDTASVFDQLYGGLQKKSTQGARTIQAENDAGIPQLRTDLTDIENQIRAKDLQFRRERQDIATTSGLTKGQADLRLSDISRKQNAELADLEVVRAARSNSLENIQSAVDRKVALQFADENNRIENLKFIYGEVKGDLTKKQDRQYQEMLNREMRAFEIAKGAYERLENDKAEMIKRAAADGASNATLQAITSAPDIQSAVKVAGKYAGDYLQTQLLKEQIQNARQSRAIAASQEARAKAEASGTGVKLSVDEKKAQTATGNLIKLLDDYKTAINGVSFLQANFPANRTKIQSLKGQITAEYKQAKQLGTLDAGVQKLIDSIIPDPSKLGISTLSNTAQVQAIDDFKANLLGGTAEGAYVDSIAGAINTVKQQAGFNSNAYANSL